jgi:aspartate/methionine/tyrosine aminotransferase
MKINKRHILSLRVREIQSPVIPIVGDLIKRNPGTISLGQGVVNYGPPVEAIDQLKNFLSRPENHKYGSVYGIPPLLESISNKLNKENGITVSESNRTVVTAGSNMAFMNVVLAITDPGDEIILSVPYYFNHEMAIRLASCYPVLVPTIEDYQVQPNLIEKAITEKTRAIVTISPNNPTGAVYTEAALREINEICRAHGVYHISDEAYEYFTYNEVKHFSPGSIPLSESYTISLFSFSKAYGMASWRIGYMVIPEHLIDSINKIQDTILICPPVVSQFAAIGALQAGSAFIQEKLRSLSEIRKGVVNNLKRVSDICTVPETQGGFYLLLKVKTKLNDMKIIEQLVRDFRVAAIPGSTFGLNDGCYLRISYGALDASTSIEGIERLVKGLRSIVGG